PASSVIVDSRTTRGSASTASATRRSEALSCGREHEGAENGDGGDALVHVVSSCAGSERPRETRGNKRPVLSSVSVIFSDRHLPVTFGG
ncbi:hypothetical protein, partial [Microbacterium lacticum]|uniref:hypothetical protein n=1 Tax=Microbacterium lacticum TaxID=33885 RepID=UPI001F5A5DE1